MLNYKGYIGKVVFDDEADIFHGEVINIKDVITFQGTSVEELRQAFKDSVDDYLEFCEERGEQPDKPFSGRFLVRVTPELHKKISVAARTCGESVNAWVNDQLIRALDLGGSSHQGRHREDQENRKKAD